MEYSLLIVDDEPDNLRILSSLLREEHQVIVAKSGHQALTLAQDMQPDLILLDVVMPNMTGFEVIEILKKQTSTQDIPVIFITGLQSSKDETLGFELGAVDYIHKPFNPAIVKARVASQLQIIHQRQELKQLSEKLQKASEAKGMFLANMSHEIRTPLTTIIGYTESLIAEELPELERPNALAIVNNSSKHLLSLVNDILDFSKIEAGELSIELLPTELNMLFEQVHIMCLELAKKKGLNIEWRLLGELPSHIKTDPTRLKQILINLLSNAIKFTDVGTISLQLQAKDGTLTIAVSDQGIGIAEDKVKNLFTSFSQGDNSTSRQYGGTGLGLSISQNLAGKLGGNIVVESKLGEGSTFTLTTPATPTANSKQMSSLLFCSPYTASNKKIDQFEANILLAEDHPENQRLFAMILTSMGLKVDTVDNGEMAVKACLENHYDLVLMDTQMPIMSGMEAQKLIRTCGLSIPIIALTANVMKEEVDSYLAAGFNDHLAKPLDREDLQKKLNRYCQIVSDNVIAEPLLTETVFNELREKFSNSFEDYKVQLQDALNSSNYIELAQVAHKFQGAARSFHFEREGLIAEALEQHIYHSSKVIDKTAIELINQLKKQIDKKHVRT